jgi:hypothetical protein
MQAMWSFLDQPKPVMVLIRPVRSIHSLAFGFVDASGEGLGGTTRYRTEEIRNLLSPARLGFWCSEISETCSNYQFRNLVEHIKHESRKGLLAGKEVWIYTDNTVTKRAWYNGTSHDVALFKLVLELKHEMLAGKFVLKVVHVAGLG